VSNFALPVMAKVFIHERAYIKQGVLVLYFGCGTYPSTIGKIGGYLWPEKDFYGV
jgi:hypothetical protein